MLYQECIKCPKIGVSCDGPNFVAMPAQELLAWCKERKAYLHLTNAQLAEMSNVPKGTIDRLFAGEHVDFRFETVRPVVRALVGGDWSGNPCPTPPDGEGAERDKVRELEATLRWREDTIKDLKEKNASLEILVKNTNARATTDKDFMREQIKSKTRTIRGLVIALVFCAVIAIVAQVV